MQGQALLVTFGPTAKSDWPRAAIERAGRKRQCSFSKSKDQSKDERACYATALNLALSRAAREGTVLRFAGIRCWMSGYAEDDAGWASEYKIVINHQRRMVRKTLFEINRCRLRRRCNLRCGNLVVEAPAHVFVPAIASVTPPGVLLGARV